jgi:hypothetical protein
MMHNVVALARTTIHRLPHDSEGLARPQVVYGRAQKRRCCLLLSKPMRRRNAELLPLYAVNETVEVGDRVAYRSDRDYI